MNRSSFLGSLDATERSDTRFVTSGLMSDTDRQVYFSDHVIELQNAEDEKRRRIRDARRRAEKAQVSPVSGEDLFFAASLAGEFGSSKPFVVPPLSFSLRRAGWPSTTPLGNRRI